MTDSHPLDRPLEVPGRFPLSGLLALGTAGFITIMTEALPAGVLPAMGADLAVSEASAGQAVTLYALGSIASAIPLTAATIGWPRKYVLLIAISGFAIANTVTAVSTSYPLTLAARLIGGVVAGLLWALLAGYARRMTAPAHRGKALAIAMAGTPIALSVGVPAGTALAEAIGWRAMFALISVLTAGLIGWVVAAVPALPGQAEPTRPPIRRVARIAGVAPVLTVTAMLVLAHNVLYTYIAALLGSAGLADRVGEALLVFGVSSLASISITGALIDRYLRPLMVGSCAVFAVAALVLAICAAVPWLAFLSAAGWGLAFGGTATLLQTAVAEAAGPAAEIAQSLLVTCWNSGIAGGGVVGGLLLAGLGPTALAWSALALASASLVTTVAAREHGFPDRTRRAPTASAHA
ncbi:MFS transporter [Nocardia sp. NPDC047648]|uniref:MFS transporter n=1 Tax=Nocardia sp. NPDC047648 TaxID=3155625 RepID=UPI0033C03C3B